jgi:hypothetical protein
MSWSFGTVPGGRVGNEIAGATLAGYTFAWAGLSGGTSGGILNVRVALRGGPLGNLARALSRVEGVRVTSGPAMAGGGACYVVHCAGFKMVLSSPAPGSDTACGLATRTPPPPVAVRSPLAAALDGLMRAVPGPAPPPLGAAARPRKITPRAAGSDSARPSPGSRAGRPPA